jgi:hypothetical protein
VSLGFATSRRASTNKLPQDGTSSSSESSHPEGTFPEEGKSTHPVLLLGIVGGVLGGLALLILPLVLCIRLKSRRRQQYRETMSEPFVERSTAQIDRFSCGRYSKLPTTVQATYAQRVSSSLQALPGVLEHTPYGINTGGSSQSLPPHYDDVVARAPRSRLDVEIGAVPVDTDKTRGAQEAVEAEAGHVAS